MGKTVLLVVACAAATLLGGCAGQNAAEPTPDAAQVNAATTARTTVVVYRGPASCDGCSEAAAAWIRKVVPKFSVVYAGPAEKEKVTAALLGKAVLYVQPGGDTSVGKADKLLGPVAKTAIVSYVRSGGKYLGICQGAYLAGQNPGMGMLSPADTGQYIVSKGATTKSEADTLVPLMYRGRKVSAYFQDGPYITGHTKNMVVVARYTNGLSAAVVKSFGLGKVGVVGTHPEAPVSWYREAGLSTSARAGNQELGNDVLAKVLS